MKAAISAMGKDLESDVDQRFGRAQYFLIVDLDSGAFELIDNGKNLELMGGAGIKAAESIASQEVDVLITGHCGPKAFRTLTAAGVKIVIGAEGSIRDAIEKLKNGEYEFAKSPDVQGHW